MRVAPQPNIQEYFTPGAYFYHKGMTRGGPSLRSGRVRLHRKGMTQGPTARV